MNRDIERDIEKTTLYRERYEVSINPQEQRCRSQFQGVIVGHETGQWKGKSKDGELGQWHRCKDCLEGGCYKKQHETEEIG